MFVQRVDGAEVQGPHGEGDHGRLRPQRPKEGHCAAEHGTSNTPLQLLLFKDPGLFLVSPCCITWNAIPTAAVSGR